jgi:hypothetical protein
MAGGMGAPSCTGVATKVVGPDGCTWTTAGRCECYKGKCAEIF